VQFLTVMVFVNSLVCLFSAACHLWYAKSPDWFHAMNFLDRLGISVSAVSAGAILTWSSTACRTATWQYACMGVQLLAFTASVVLLVRFNKRDAKMWYTGLVVIAAVSWCLAFSQAFSGVIDTGVHPFHALGTYSLAMAASFVVCGLFFFFTRVPECLAAPGTFDLVGHSHQLWHLWVASGMFFVLRGTAELLSGLPAIHASCLHI